MVSKNEDLYLMDGSEESAASRAERVTEQAQKLGRSIGQTIGSATQTVQNTFRHTKNSTKAAMGTVVNGIDISTEYLATQGVEGVMEDLETLIRRHPFQALMVGLSMGYLLSRSQQR
jgi:ElaB/YqjD/DUF883 family membrane-anchored ribosome-binding protein